MPWQSFLAVYFLIWVFSVFLVIPFGVRTAEEAGAELVPGQAESAPHGYRIGVMALRATLVATALFALFCLNYRFGWLTLDQFAR